MSRGTLAEVARLYYVRDLTQQQIAVSQLERAVLLFLEERDFVSSVTLACAGYKFQFIVYRRFDWDAFRGHFTRIPIVP